MGHVMDQKLLDYLRERVTISHYQRVNLEQTQRFYDDEYREALKQAMDEWKEKERETLQGEV
jgi:hypothetical protein